MPVLFDPAAGCLTSLPNRWLQGGLHGCRMAALNGLGPEPRCAIKARRIAQLGPPTDLLVKVCSGGWAGLDRTDEKVTQPACEEQLLQHFGISVAC